MKNIINYFRELFCKHDYIISEHILNAETDSYRRRSIKVSMICKKCGYHKNFWKFFND